MTFSNSCLYALHALAFLAQHAGDRFALSRGVAAAHGLPELYLLGALKRLASAGVLLSARAPDGDYRLARPPGRVTLLDVVEAVDGPIRGEVPRWAPAVGGKLDGRLQEACAAAAERVRARLRKVSVADPAGEGGGGAGGGARASARQTRARSPEKGRHPTEVALNCSSSFRRAAASTGLRK
jgi:Rrf2 family protein